MKRFGYAIRTGGDPEIAGALAAGIDRATRRAMERHVSESVRRVAMMRHTPQEWEAMTIKARYDYGQDKPLPRWAERVLVGWAMVWLGLCWLHRQQDMILTRRAEV